MTGLPPPPWPDRLPGLLVLAAGGTVLAQRREMRRRAELVARACHEIRGPLAAAGLAAHAAARRGSPLPPSVVEHELWRAARAVEDLGAAGSGARDAPAAGRDRAERVNAAALLERQAALWTRVGAARGRVVHPLAVVDGRGDGSPPLVAADPVRLAQATANLIANALDHGAGDVQLVLRTTAGRVRIEVSDAGPGLPAALGALIARPRAGRGARGRGLAIAAEIVGRYNGALLAAPVARGARLVLDLPALPTAAEGPAGGGSAPGTGPIAAADPGEPRR
jgi:signal transduction histidine kinase